MAGGNKLGDAYVKITGDKTELDATLAEAKANVETETAAMGESVEKNLTSKWKKASSGVTSFIGSVTALIGVSALMGRIGYAIGEMALGFVRARDNADAFRLSLRELDTQKLRSELNELHDSSTKATSELLNYGARFTDWLGLTIESSREAKAAILELAIAERQAEEVARRKAELAEREAKAEKERAQAAAQRRSEIDAENEQLEIDALEGVARIEAERDRAKRAALRKLAEEEDGIARARLEYQIRLIEEKYAAEVRSAQDAEREKERIARESADRQAKTLADAMSRVLRSINEGQVGGIGNLSGTIETLADRMEAVVEAAAFASTRRKS